MGNKGRRGLLWKKEGQSAVKGGKRVEGEERLSTQGVISGRERIKAGRLAARLEPLFLPPFFLLFLSFSPFLGTRTSRLRALDAAVPLPAAVLCSLRALPPPPPAAPLRLPAAPPPGRRGLRGGASGEEVGPGVGDRTPGVEEPARPSLSGPRSGPPDRLGAGPGVGLAALPAPRRQRGPRRVGREPRGRGGPSPPPLPSGGASGSLGGRVGPLTPGAVYSTCGGPF